MENVASLIQEIDNLLTNPDDAALKSFHCFLQNESISKDALSVWARAKPCQIVPLATLVVESTTGFDVFRSLSRFPELVDAILEVKPCWLENSLDKTVTTVIGNPSPDHLVDCAALVSRCMLKQGAALASTLQLIQDASVCVTESPDEASLRRLSELLSAVPSNILDFFTEDSLTGLSSRCKEVCSRSVNSENNIEIMLAQDILAQVAVAFQTPPTPSKSSLETPPGAKFSEACRKRVFRLFSDANAATTLRITVLRLSLFCSEEHGSSSPVALEGIRLAQRIIAPLSVPVRQQWAGKYKILVEKFLSRLRREALGLNAQLEGVVFCILLLGAEEEMSQPLKKAAIAVLVALCNPQSGYESAIAAENDKAIAEVLVRLWSSKSGPNKTLPGNYAMVVTRMLMFVVEQCQPWRTNVVNTILKLHQAKNIMTALDSASHRSSVLLCVVDFIQLGYVPEWWDSEVTFLLSLRDGESGNCIGEEVCSRSLDQLRFELATSISSLLLTAAWHSSKSLQQPEACQRLLNRLKGTSFKALDLGCSYSAERIMGREYDGALLDAQAESEDIRARLEKETAQRMTLEGQLAQKKKLLEEEEQASDALQQYLEAAEREGFQATQALRQAREDYVELLQEADRRVQVTEFNATEEKLSYRTELLRREMDLEEELAEVRSTLEHKDKELQLERQQRANLEAETEMALAHSNSKIEKLGLAVAEKDKALEEADSLRTRLMALLGGRLD